MTEWLRVLGAGFLTRLGHLGRAGVFLGGTLFCLVSPPIKLARIVRQIWFVGWKSLVVICLTGAFTGMVLALQGFPTLKRVGSEAFLGPLVALRSAYFENRRSEISK